MQSLKFKNDTLTRKRFFDESAMSHPAKLHSGLLLEILSRYCPEPCTILDPMGGIGTLMLAAQYGHTVIINELEPHFLETLPKSWAKIQQNGPALGHTLGSVLILRGDARHLPIGSADHIVTSPPYEASEVGGLSPIIPISDKPHNLKRLGVESEGVGYAKRLSVQLPQVPVEGHQVSKPQEVSNVSGDGDSLPRKPRAAALASMNREKKGYTRPSAIITSPPYEASQVAQSSDGEANRRFRAREYEGDALKGMGLAKGYTRPVDAVVSSPPYANRLADTYVDGDPQRMSYEMGKAKIDSVITSPPYAESEVAYITESRGAAWKRGVGGHEAQIDRYGATTENIGNQKGGDLYALLVYNRLRREPSQSVEIHLCGKCLPAEIAEQLKAPMGSDVSLVEQNMSGKYLSSEATSDAIISVLPAEQKSHGDIRDVLPVRQFPLVGLVITNGKVEHPRGEAWLGIDSEGQSLPETDAPVPDADRRVWLSTMLKMQKKLAENGITASETWLRSVAPATTENTPLLGCILCNASLAASPSKQGTQTPSVVLRLRFVTPNIAPLSVLAGEQKGNYWFSMLQVYEECFRVLKSQGVMALVLKGFTRDGKYVDLPQQTADLVESLGFVKFDEWRRELWSLSFWRILQGTDKEESVVARRRGLFDLDIQEVKTMKRVSNGKLDERLRYEHVLAFMKG